MTSLRKNKYRICADCSTPSFAELNVHGDPVWFCPTCNKSWKREIPIKVFFKKFEGLLITLSIVLFVGAVIGGAFYFSVENNKQARIEALKTQADREEVTTYSLCLVEEANPAYISRLLRTEMIKQGKKYEFISLDNDSNTVYVRCNAIAIENIKKLEFKTTYSSYLVEYLINSFRKEVKESLKTKETGLMSGNM